MIVCSDGSVNVAIISQFPDMPVLYNALMSFMPSSSKNAFVRAWVEGAEC